jgi:hypothetical protein
MMKAIFNGSMHHNMRDGCTTRQDGVFPEEDLLEITDVWMDKLGSWVCCSNVFAAFEKGG